MTKLRLFFSRHHRALMIVMGVEAALVVAVAGGAIANAATDGRVLCNLTAGANLDVGGSEQCDKNSSQYEYRKTEYKTGGLPDPSDYPRNTSGRGGNGLSSFYNTPATYDGTYDTYDGATVNNGSRNVAAEDSRYSGSGPSTYDCTYNTYPGATTGCGGPNDNSAANNRQSLNSSNTTSNNTSSQNSSKSNNSTQQQTQSTDTSQSLTSNRGNYMAGPPTYDGTYKTW